MAWPDPQGVTGRENAVFTSKVAAAQEHAKAVDARVQSEAAAELELHAEFHKALLEVTKGAIERARSSAETVQKAAAAILTIYTAVLGVAFSVSDNPLPSRGVIPALYLGLAIVLSTAYLAYLTKPPASPAPKPTGQFRLASLERSRAFIVWVGTTVRHRGYLLRAGVVALGIALAFLPAAFLGALPGFDRIHPAPDPPAAATVRWPTVPAQTAANPALQKILFTAKVKEAADKRAANKAALKDANRSWWFAAVAGLIAVLIIPLVGSYRLRSPLASG